MAPRPHDGAMRPSLFDRGDGAEQSDRTRRGAHAQAGRVAEAVRGTRSRGATRSERAETAVGLRLERRVFACEKTFTASVAQFVQHQHRRRKAERDDQRGDERDGGRASRSCSAAVVRAPRGTGMPGSRPITNSSGWKRTVVDTSHVRDLKRGRTEVRSSQVIEPSHEPRGLKILVSAVRFRPWAPPLHSSKIPARSYWLFGASLTRDGPI
jgi:hypothetical protein